MIIDCAVDLSDNLSNNIIYKYLKELLTESQRERDREHRNRMIAKCHGGAPFLHAIKTETLTV